MTSYTIQNVEYKAIPNHSAYYISDEGAVYSSITDRFLQPQTDRDGYLYISLKTDDGGRKVAKLHRAVIEAWEGPIPENLEVLHLNDVKSDNRFPENIRMGTHSENMQNMKEYKRLTQAEVLEIHALHMIHNARGAGSVAALARRYGVSASSIKRFVRPKTERRARQRLEMLNTLRAVIK